MGVVEALELCLLPHYVIRLGVAVGLYCGSIYMTGCNSSCYCGELRVRVSSSSRVLWWCSAMDQTAEQYIILVGGSQ